MSLFFALYLILFAAEPKGSENYLDTHLVGVYKGRPLFIKNAYDPVAKTFCVNSILLNDRTVSIPPKLSAIKIDFKGMDLYTPVAITIVHSDSCQPIVINPDAIMYHSMFSFGEITATDTLITWETAGDKQGGYFDVEKVEQGLWQSQVELPAKGVYGGGYYEFRPRLDQGSNKFRIRYTFPNGEYLYTHEIDMHYYPEPVTFSPRTTNMTISFSRPAYFEIYDAGSKKVLEGTGDQVDVSKLPDGNYVIYFDGDDPGMFVKESR